MDPTPEQVTAFAAQRSDQMTASDTALTGAVERSLTDMYSGSDDWFDPIIDEALVEWNTIYAEAGSDDGPAQAAAADQFAADLQSALEQTSTKPGLVTDSQVETTTRWVSTFTINNATMAAAATTPGARVRWTTMRDEDVRTSHRALEGQTRPAGATFEVDGASLHYPGEPVGPPEAWINCRCTLMPLEAQMTAATTTAPPTVSEPVSTYAGSSSTTIEPEVTEPPADAEVDADEPTDGYEDLDHEVAWHGVVAPIDVQSGDRRIFSTGSLTNRDLPLPLRWQKADAEGHQGSVVIGNITRLWEEDGLIKAEGSFASNAEADEVMTLIAEGMLRGVSVDLDGDAVFDLVNPDGSEFNIEDFEPGKKEPVVRLLQGRVTSAAVVPIPAYQDAFVALGSWADVEPTEQVLTAAGGCIPCAAEEMDAFAAELQQFAVSDAEWDGSASRFDDDQWKASTVVDRGEQYATAKERYAVPIREPNGDLSRAGVHAAAGRIDQVDAPADAIASGKRKLVAAYKELGEDPPEGLQAAAAGWVGVYSLGAAANPFEKKKDAPADDEPADAEVKVGDTVTWTSGPESDGEVEEHTGTVEAIDGDTATISDGDDTYEVPVADLTVVDSGADAEADAAAADPLAYAVTSNPSTKDGPGWITHPDDTQRLRDYWTRGAGAAKIRWGQPGDFNRCRRQLAKYIPNQHYLAGTCSNMHKVALGVWPGQEAAAETLTAAAAPAFTLVAAGQADLPPADWFADPELDALTPMTVEGRHVYGHLAAWDSCHLGLGLSVGDGDECVSPPPSASDYAYFRVHGQRTREGEVIPVGHITLGTGHAPASMAARPAAAHYDNTGSVVASVVVGEDEHGIWFSGALAPDADPDKVLGAVLSGDWRTIRGKYELVAALGVNVPGFPIPRMQIAASAEGTTSLVASGIVRPSVQVGTPVDPAEIANAVYNRVVASQHRARTRQRILTQMRGARRSELVAAMTRGD